MKRFLTVALLIFCGVAYALQTFSIEGVRKIAAPTANDDSADGYIVGCVWLDTTADQTYVCIDNTAAAAVWNQVDVSTSGFLQVANNLSDVANALTSRTNLGLAIDTNVQRWDADLDTWALTTPSANGRSLVSGADYAAMRTLLSLVPGTNVQAYDADLLALAGLISAADKGIQWTGVGTAGVYNLTAFAKTILDDADEATFKATVNLEIDTDVQAWDADLDTWAGVTPSANGQSLVSAANYAAMTILLGLGTASSPTFTGLTLGVNAAVDPLLTWDGDTTDGTQTWMEDEAYFAFSHALQLGTTADTTNGIVRHTGTDIEARLSGAWVSLSAGATGGEANTASNAGTGVSAFYQKSAVDLEFNAHKSENDRLTVALDAVSHDIEYTLVEGNIILDNCDNTASAFKSTRTGVKRTLWIDAGAFIARTTNGMAAATEEYATNDVMSDYFAADPTTDEAVQVRIAMPDAWDRGTIKVKFFWTTGTAAGSVVWGIRGRAVSNDDAMDGAWGAAVTVTDAVIATGDLHVSGATAAVTIGGTPALGDAVWLEPYRDADNVSDDNTGDAKFLGIQIQYTEGSTEPSAW